MTPGQTPDLLCHNWLLLGSYILCDGDRRGFPIVYASSAYVELFGFSAAECLQKKCGALVGIERIKAADQELASVSEVSRLSIDEARVALDFLHDQSVHEVKRMLAESTGSFVTVNRTCSGRLIPIAVIVHALKHPVSKQSCAIGLQFDLSDDLTVAKLFDAILRSEYHALKQRHCRLGVCMQMLTRDDVKCFLHRKMEDVSGGPGWARTLNEKTETAIVSGTDAATETGSGPPSILPFTPRIPPSMMLPSSPPRSSRSSPKDSFKFASSSPSSPRMAPINPEDYSFYFRIPPEDLAILPEDSSNAIVTEQLTRILPRGVSSSTDC
eukprot:gnl/MRDRNA2_/MRDRNA2_91340_c0_seq1.p1 gnl/MRDRNA2_/MRDRNA2_91340_c0~~gnl/MRDRNA2_/MRDRNA2_91340_c0_seq1.p1  ORF type:complete len:326 (+),score=23.06 gnl/MRDRNA2_/MRDRNA2_91340_c0_seq1:83-1060(+)